MFSTILVAYDGSDHADNALKLAAGLAKTHGAALHVVHTPQLDSPPIVLGAYVSQLDMPPSKEQYEEVGRKMIEKARQVAQAAGAGDIQGHIGRGAPADFILSTAKKIDADLIILGRRGLGAIRSIALGSVSNAVAHGAQCPCMTVI